MWIGKEKRVDPWCVPPSGILKFNVDGASRGRASPTGIGGVLHNDKGKIFGNVYQRCMMRIRECPLGHCSSNKSNYMGCPSLELFCHFCFILCNLVNSLSEMF